MFISIQDEYTSFVDNVKNIPVQLLKSFDHVMGRQLPHTSFVPGKPFLQLIVTSVTNIIHLTFH